MFLNMIDGKAVGLAGIACVGSKEKVRHRAEFGISVDQEYWNLGIGRALTKSCIECAKSAGYSQLELDVVAENDNAIALYESLGFTEYGRKKSVSPSEEALFFIVYSIFLSSGNTIRSIVVIHAVPPMTLEMGSAINTPSDPK